MIYRRLGRTELMVSEIGFGGLPIGGVHWGDVRDEQSLAALQRAFDLGVNFFDTADVYGRGHSEEIIGQALSEVRERVIIATKAGLDFSRGAYARPNFAPEYIRSALEASLRRLRTDYIDVYLLHNPPQKLVRDDAIWQTLADLRQGGAIRFFGVSAKTVNDGMAYLKAEREQETTRFGDVLQVPYNMLDQAAAAKGLFIAAHRQDWGVVSRVPLASGMLAGKYAADHYFPPDDFRADWTRERLAETVRRVEAVRFLASEGRSMAQTAIAFVLSQEAASTVITGARTAEQVEENAGACAWAPLPPDDLRAAQELHDAGFLMK
jgi:aryl-alcohol dehydrogenase-like predicted oxidoreductase